MLLFKEKVVLYSEGEKTHNYPNSTRGSRAAYCWGNRIKQEVQTHQVNWWDGPSSRDPLDTSSKNKEFMFIFEFCKVTGMVVSTCYQ